MSKRSISVKKIEFILKKTFHQMEISLKTLNNDKYSWLHNSEFYKSLIEGYEIHEDDNDKIHEDNNNKIHDKGEIHEDDKDKIYVPYICSKYCFNIPLMLKTVDYWGVHYLPFNFFDRILDEKPFKELLEIYSRTNCEKINFLLDICNSPENEIFDIAFKYSRIDCLQFLYQSDLKFRFNDKIPKYIFKEIPKSFNEILDIEDNFYLNLINDIEKIKHLLSDIFKYKYKKCILHLIKIKYKFICKVLSRHGLIDYLKIAVSQGHLLDQSCVIECAISGNVETLKYILEKCPECYICHSFVTNAVDNKNLDILKYINETQPQEIIEFKRIYEWEKISICVTMDIV